MASDYPLREGKLPTDYLREMLHAIPKGSLVTPRQVGIDVGATVSRGRYRVSSSDPITGAKKRLGWYAVNISANDVATSGIVPDAMDVVVLFPEGSRLSQIRDLMKDVVDAASELGITISKGHTEITGGIARPIITATAFGSGDRFVTAADAKPGDAILMTKTAGIEGTSILAGLDHARKSLPAEVCERGERLIDRISILPEARIAFRTGRVHAMHDVTEGGVIGAVLEMALASRLGFEIDADSVPVDSSTEAICEELSIEPLKLIGSGALLIACSSKDARKVEGEIEREGIRCSRIGKFIRERNRRRVVTRGRAQAVKGSSTQEELWSALRRGS